MPTVFISQNPLLFVPAIAGAVLLVLFLVFRCKKSSPKATVTKALVSVMFIFTWMVCSKYVGLSKYTMCIGAGLVFGLLGDIWLDLKFCCRPEDVRFYTYAGFLSFAVGHLCFVAAIVFNITGRDAKINYIAVLCALALAVVAALAIFFGEKIMKLKYGEYKLISTLYGALLFFTPAFAFFSALFGGEPMNAELTVFAIGGVFFIISDLVLSGTYFGEGKNRPSDIIINHVTYYIAQYIIAFSVLCSM